MEYEECSECVYKATTDCRFNCRVVRFYRVKDEIQNCINKNKDNKDILFIFNNTYKDLILDHICIDIDKSLFSKQLDDWVVICTYNKTEIINLED